MKKQMIAALTALMLLPVSGLQMPVQAQEKTPLSEETISYYADWKETYLRQNPYAADEAQYYVFYGGETYEQAKKTVPVTVSEAHGYGMLIAALMADYDDEAKEIFDGMYRYYLAHPSSIGPHLMAWQQSDNGKALIDTNGSDSATDGDLDIAYALLLADKRWGSSGEINYKKAADLVIGDIMEYEVHHRMWILQLGDWAHDPDDDKAPSNDGSGRTELKVDDDYGHATRSSDFILQYFPVFANVTGDDRWINVYNMTNYIIQQCTDYTKSGLLPDFCVKGLTGAWSGAPADFLESEHDGDYYYNACRTPWRICTDALLNQNAQAQDYAKKVNTCIREASGGDPQKIYAGYDRVSGKPIENWNDLCFTAPLMISASVAGDTEFHDAIRQEVLDIGVDSYFGNTIAMLCLITDDGGWLVPDLNKCPGDVDASNQTDIADLQCMYNWLMKNPPAFVLKDPEAGDLNGDGVIDARDLTLLRRILLQKAEA